MTALEEIKKALEGVTPVTWGYQFTEENGEVFIIANGLGGLIGAALPWPTEVEEKDFRRVVSYARYIAAVNPAAISELLSNLESLQAEENRLRTIALDMQAGYREATARAETTEKALDSLCAWLLHRFGPDTPEGREASCRMSSRTALASTGGEYHAE